MLGRPQPILQRQTRDAYKVPNVVRDAHRTGGDRLSGDERIHSSDLLPRLFEVTPYRERLASCGLVEGQHARMPQQCFKETALRSWRTRPGEPDPDFYFTS